MGSPADAPGSHGTTELRVLLVEDNVDHALLAQDALAQLDGVEVTHVREAAEALDVSRRETFDAIVVDYRLPDRSGVKLCNEFRERGAEGIIVLLSSATRDTLGEAAMDAGADEYLSKSAGFERRVVDAIRSRVEA